MRLAAACLTAVLSLGLPGTAPAQTRVDSVVVAPNEDGLSYYISPMGAHLVAVTQKGSRFIVTRDGVPGPAVDRILNPGTAAWIMNFSPDGERYGYTAKVGQDWIAVVDGKEVYRQPIGTNDLVNRGGGPHLRFSPNGKHWVLYYTNPSVVRPTDDPSWYLWDGVMGPKGADANLVVSPDGEHHAYVVVNPVNANQRALVVDGSKPDTPVPIPSSAPTGRGLHHPRGPSAPRVAGDRSAQRTGRGARRQRQDPHSAGGQRRAGPPRPRRPTGTSGLGDRGGHRHRAGQRIPPIRRRVVQRGRQALRHQVDAVGRRDPHRRRGSPPRIRDGGQRALHRRGPGHVSGAGGSKWLG
ncbi:MAG: hypothetical protein R2882_12360 [Gemmatimonadales bacterium]